MASDVIIELSGVAPNWGELRVRIGEVEGWFRRKLIGRFFVLSRLFYGRKPFLIEANLWGKMYSFIIAGAFRWFGCLENFDNGCWLLFLCEFSELSSLLYYETFAVCTPHKLLNHLLVGLRPLRYAFKPTSSCHLLDGIVEDGINGRELATTNRPRVLYWGHAVLVDIIVRSNLG